ncbi:phycocyanobilin:ferredoxin oxidoreductase [Acaryochloris sp. IP29b_bin.137]|uniref:phycocyanobilin:ferredoxin oxidoreductase n=1 Tax=Acaryochloris sp. IP29b_bin.137 TaxID=2969217 RepID=UPI002636D957|nr:phycocyanobilin:ferredoxin oxidoreductase [Acaryochloris sp. IP29b_bin.137]
MSLRQQQHPLIQEWANRIEAIWTQYLVLSDYPLPSEFGHVEGRLEGEFLVIENVCYQAPPFRKLHLELAKVGTGLDILHCVMFPDPQYDLPLFGTDLVGGRGGISAAIADLSPVTAEGKLSPAYHDHLSGLSKVQFAEPRQLPAWGNIFSEFCLFIRPQTPQEEAQFLDRVSAYLSWHCQQALTTQPVPESEMDGVLGGQRRYCQQQQQNDKTRRILEKAFGTHWAERYMTTVLFDCP